MQTRALSELIGTASCAVVTASLAGCLTAPATADRASEGVLEQAAVSASVKRARAELIRDSAAEMGVYNAALLGGIAVSETNFAHCWEEAQFACKGPATAACGGGPIIAGAGDGPCVNEQGGLGMFQFDAGTYAQTLATYTDAILSVEGNTAQAVSFVVDKVQLDIDGVADWESAVAWMNAVPVVAGDPLVERWGRLMACRYNGCCSTSSLCNSRAAGYRDNAIDLYNEFGADFWNTADRCRELPADGIIDQRTACYTAAGEPRFWRREATGFGGNHEWTNSTTAVAPANFAKWLLKPGRATTYHIEAYIEGGQVRAAHYEIVHGGQSTIVTIDQSAVTGFVALGDFELTGDGTEFVALGDNTGAVGERIAFDALRVTPLDGGDNGGDEPPSMEGGCAVGGSGGWLMIGLVALIPRRRQTRWR